MTVLSLLEMLMSTLALQRISKYLGIYQHQWRLSCCVISTLCLV